MLFDPKFYAENQVLLMRALKACLDHMEWSTRQGYEAHRDATRLLDSMDAPEDIEADLGEKVSA